MTSKDKPFDVKATNPRYNGAMMSDVARALLLPTDPELRAKRIAEWKEGRRSVTDGKVAE
jgi:hypothetical protein